jgi:hypothetical protein
MNLQRRARPLPDATLPRAVLRTACPALDAAKRNLHRLFTRALGRRRGGSPRRSFSAIDEGRAAGSVWASPFPLPLGAFWDAGPAFRDPLWRKATRSISGPERSRGRRETTSSIACPTFGPTIVHCLRSPSPSSEQVPRGGARAPRGSVVKVTGSDLGFLSSRAFREPVVRLGARTNAVPPHGADPLHLPPVELNDKGRAVRSTSRRADATRASRRPYWQPLATSHVGQRRDRDVDHGPPTSPRDQAERLHPFQRPLERLRLRPGPIPPPNVE